MNITEKTRKIRAYAAELGFESCGFSKARRLIEEESRLEAWLKEGRHGTMSWMEQHFDKRLDPTLLVPGAKSVVTVVMSYHQPELFTELIATTHKPQISKYALGDDYHLVLKEKLFELYSYLDEINAGVQGRVFVDSAPVMDKAWARLSGVGWLGKNGNMLNRTLGSWFFIGEMIVDTDFEYDQPVADHCGSCTRCIDACPTQAIYAPHQVDGSKCISYLTIELKEAIPETYHQAMGPWMYGCDICQDVCPWNRKALPGSQDRLFARTDLLEKNTDFWEELDLLAFRELFRNSAVKRTKLSGLQRNFAIVKDNLRAG
jgi:epoxyqueuosine reductase